MGISDIFRKKKIVQSSPRGVMNTEIPCTGVSLDDLSNLDSKTIEKTVQKNIDQHIKNLHKLPDEELKDIREKVKRERTPRNSIKPEYRLLWAVEKQKIVLSGLDRVIEAIDEEIKKRRINNV